MLAARNGHTDTMQALAALGADLHIQEDVSSRHTQHVSIEDVNTSCHNVIGVYMYRQLRVHGIVCTPQFGWTALVLAVVRGHTDTVQALAALVGAAGIDFQDMVSHNHCSKAHASYTITTLVTCRLYC